MESLWGSFSRKCVICGKAFQCRDSRLRYCYSCFKEELGRQSGIKGDIPLATIQKLMRLPSKTAHQVLSSLEEDISLWRRLYE